MPEEGRNRGSRRRYLARAARIDSRSRLCAACPGTPLASLSSSGKVKCGRWLLFTPDNGGNVVGGPVGRVVMVPFSHSFPKHPRSPSTPHLSLPLSTRRAGGLFWPPT